ncbi:MAG TPA: ATPase, T2SS/T4P/T4SS family [Tepidisphaeraceae bacterium]|jgi:pilus assembly protein CpaF|nr:ATPase, T2SS/T4P/T4SS family [Tepidisphaeraceae bacterium]
MGLFTKSTTTPATPAPEESSGGVATLEAPPKPSTSGIFSKSPSPAPATKPTEALTPAPISHSKPAPIQTAPILTPQQREQQLQHQQLKSRIHQKLVERLDVQNLRTLPQDTVRQEVRVLIRDLCQSEKGLINSADQERLMDDVMDETFGLGPLETLLKDPSISDILVNRFDRIYVERKGRLELSEVAFRDNKHLRQIIDRIVALVGRRVDETSPMVDARLADGSRVNAIIPPLALDGCAMSIRRFGSKPLQVEDLVKHGAFPQAFIDFMSAAVIARCNVLISGGTGSGKTTLLNCLSRYIPESERVITIEDAAELQLQQPHVVRLETRPANIEGKGEVNQRDLVKNCLRMRPDRVIIGECRSGETLDMLQAMNTGHEGSMTTVHANTPRDALSRIEVMIAMAGYDIPTRALRAQTAGAVQLIIQAQRITGGRRKVTRISEITGMEGEQIQMHDIFAFEQTGVDEHGHAIGRFIATGIRPKCLERIESRGIKLPPEIFQRQVFPA